MAAKDDQMLEFQCSCGKKLRAHNRLAGKRSRCPSCRRVVQIPGGPESPQPVTAVTDDPFASDPFDSSDSGSLPMSSGPVSASVQQPAAALQATAVPLDSAAAPATVSVRDRLAQLKAAQRFPTVELICGGLMLLTFLLPWWTRQSFSGGRVTVMSWDVLKDAPASLICLMVSLWLIGLATIITACVLRGLPAAFTHGGMGAGGVLLLCIISAMWYSNVEAVPGVATSVVILRAFSLMFIMVQIVATNVRLKCGASTVVRAIQGLASGLVIILTIVGLVMMLVELGDLPKFARSEMWPDILFSCVSDAAMIAAMILILVHAAAMTIRTKTLSEIGLYLIYGVLMAVAAYVIIRPAVAMKEASAVLLSTNVVFLVAPPLVLMCLGATKAICSHLGPAQQGK